jgi:hypothetical protein
MTTISFDDIFSKDAIEEVMQELETKRDGCGVDGMPLSQLREFWEVNGDDILDMLKKDAYEPGMVREVEIINNKANAFSSTLLMKRYTRSRWSTISL